MTVDAAGASAGPSLPSSTTALAALLGLPLCGMSDLADTPYRRFMKPKGHGERPMAEPPEGLKEAQRKLLVTVWERFSTHPAAHDVAGRSALTNAREHVGARVVLKLDAADFFPSIVASRIAGFLESQGASAEVAGLLMMLATSEDRDGTRRLPQGAPTSNAIASVLCRRLDARLAGLAKGHRATYTRYVDDITFSWRENRESVNDTRNKAVMIMRSEGFEENRRKTRIFRGTGMAVTGYIVGADGIRVSRDVRRRLRAAEFNLNNGKGSPESVASLRAYVESTRA